jgi:hypothetical protein
MDEVVRQAIAQDRRTQFLHEFQIPVPVPVVATLLKKIAPDRTPVLINDAGSGAFDSGGEREIPSARFAARPNSLRGGRCAIHRRWRQIHGFFSQDVEKRFHVVVGASHGAPIVTV